MSEKKSEINVLSCKVKVDENGNGTFEDCRVQIKGTISKKLGSKVLAAATPTWICDLSGIDVCSVLEPFGATIRIKMATLRDLSLAEFNETVKKLEGAVVKFDEIDDWTGKTEKSRMPQLVAWMVKAGKSEEDARAIYDDPERRAKAAKIMEEHMKKVSIDV